MTNGARPLTHIIRHDTTDNGACAAEVMADLLLPASLFESVPRDQDAVIDTPSSPTCP
jgi:hypothetical protein